MDIQIENQVKEKPIEMKGPSEVPVISGELMGNLEINSVGQMFDLKPSDISLFEDKLVTLIDYAKSQTEDHSIEGIKWAIRDLQYKVGTPPIGEKFVNYLSKYAYLKLQSNQLNEDLKKYEKNG